MSDTLQLRIDQENGEELVVMMCGKGALRKKIPEMHVDGWADR
jgi:hypothetical protein